MGNGGEAVIFHRFFYRRCIRVILVEPVKRQYVWLSFYMDRRLRNGELSKELVKHLLYVLPGIHHIHWLPKLTTFRDLSHELHWNAERRSAFFQNCRASLATHLSTPSLCHPLFLEILKHKKSSRCPNLVNYVNRRNQLEVVHLIKGRFLVSSRAQ